MRKLLCNGLTEAGQATLSAAPAMRTRDRRSVKKALTYFANNVQRMAYARLRQAGYLIGSGIVESARKQIGSQRLKRAGARWSLPGACLVAKARAAWLSGDWSQLISPRLAT